MGRHAGFLTAASALDKKIPDDGTHLIYVRERDCDMEKFLADVKAATAHGLYETAVAARVPAGIAWLYPLITDGLALVAYAIDRALVGAWGTDPGFLLLLVRISLAVAAGGLVIVAGSLALRIDELRAIVAVMTDLVRRRGRA